MIDRFAVFLLLWAVVQCETLKTIDEIILRASKNAKNTLGDDEVLVDMDMRYTKEDWEAMQSNISSHKGLVGSYYLWTNKHIPYTYSSRISQSNRRLVRAAMDEWEKYTCLTFGERRGDANWINIQDDGSGCNSYVGMRRWGSQPVNLGRGCMWHHTIVHELGHAMGFQHEQQRPERDDYVTIYLNNVASGNRFNFNKINNVDNKGVKYDYLSVMHYGQTAFSNNGRITIKTKDSAYQNVIGRSPGLSFADIKLANIMYSCSARCQGVTCGKDGYIGKDCKCWCNNNSWKNRLCECGTEGCGDGGDTGGDGGGKFKCEDTNDRCQEWADRGECVQNDMYMLLNCPKACKICGEGQTCADYKSDCPRWKSEGLCTGGEYLDYMARRCQYSCGFCNITDPTCHDVHIRCEEWALRGECAANSNYMLTNCPKACQICGDNAKCVDFREECPRWQSEGHCTNDEYVEFMKRHCRKSCGICS